MFRIGEYCNERQLRHTTCGNAHEHAIAQSAGWIAHQTDYSYDATTGLDSDDSADSGVRAQTRTMATAFQAYFKNAAGSIIASGVHKYWLSPV